MESDATQSDLLTTLWVWGDKNKKQLVWGAAVLVVVGMIVAFWMAHKNETQNDANYALSKLTTPVVSGAPEATPDALLKVTSEYPNTDAAQRALLLAATDLFAQGKYDAAQAQFQKFIQQYNDSPFAGQAALGIASCDDAQGKTSEAVSAYDGVISRYPNQNVASQAKLGMARLLEAQGKFKEARSTLEELTHSYSGTISSEAFTRLQELNTAHPELQPTNTLPQMTTTPMVKPAVPAVTPAPATPAPATTNLKKP